MTNKTISIALVVLYFLQGFLIVPFYRWYALLVHINDETGEGAVPIFFILLWMIFTLYIVFFHALKTFTK